MEGRGIYWREKLLQHSWTLPGLSIRWLNVAEVKWVWTSRYRFHTFCSVHFYHLPDPLSDFWGSSSKTMWAPISTTIVSLIGLKHPSPDHSSQAMHLCFGSILEARC